MINIENGSLGDLMKSSALGPFMEAEIVSLTGRGKLRITYNWLYSALNCDPNDNSPFIWVFNKVDDQHIALSPKNGYGGKTLFASVRDDYSYYVQVQAPYSADWITAIGRDEIISFQLHDLSIGQFIGFNAVNIAVNSSIDQHGSHNGYRVMSTNPNFDQSAQWFIGITTSLQAQIKFSITARSQETMLRSQLANCNISTSKAVFEKLQQQVNTINYQD